MDTKIILQTWKNYQRGGQQLVWMGVNLYRTLICNHHGLLLNFLHCILNLLWIVVVSPTVWRNRGYDSRACKSMHHVGNLTMRIETFVICWMEMAMKSFKYSEIPLPSHAAVLRRLPWPWLPTRVPGPSWIDRNQSQMNRRYHFFHHDRGLQTKSCFDRCKQRSITKRRYKLKKLLYSLKLAQQRHGIIMQY